jgi:hypothetical protein
VSIDQTIVFDLGKRLPNPRAGWGRVHASGTGARNGDDDQIVPIGASAMVSGKLAKAFFNSMVWLSGRRRTDPDGRRVGGIFAEGLPIG